MQGEPGYLDVEGASRLARALSSEEPQAGAESLCGYRLLGLLGEGGAGRVYKAVREGSDHPVALKVMHAGADAGRARREYEILRSLRLECTPRLLDFGVSGSSVYLATEFIEGCPLDEACVGLDDRGRAEMLARACDAVQTLHEHGVIHRDLKPANILVTGGDRPRVMLVDLGLALSGGAHTLTRSGEVFGTIAFMSPEQARGEAASTRSDVYGLGATAYVVLTGSTPHDTRTAVTEAIRRVAMEGARDPRDLRRDLPRPLAAVLSKACAPRAQDRYESAAALGADLRRFVAGEPVEAAPASAWQRLMRRAARHPVVVTGLASAAVGLTSLGLSALSNWWFFREPVRLEASADGTEARLLSRSGAVIRSWRTEPRRQESPPLKVALLARLPSGEKVGLLSAAYGEEFGPARGALACFALRDLDSPLRRVLWTSGSVPPEIEAPSEVSAEGDEFFAGWAGLADVFPGVPGDEVVAIHRHRRYGRSAVRVYELSSGRVLYEAWNSGVIGSVVPSRDAEGSLLIVSALSNAHAMPGEVVEGTDRKEYPHVVFALRPVAGVRAGFVNLRCEPASRVEPEVEWFRFVAFRGGRWQMYRADLRSIRRADGHCEYEVELHPPVEDGRVAVAILVVSTDGRLVRVETNDTYQDHVNREAPADSSWSLEPRPWWEPPESSRPGCRPWPRAGDG